VTYAWYDLVGNAGVLLIVTAYMMLQLRRLEATELTFSLMNVIGAALIIVSLLYAFNTSAMVMEVFWLAISLVGVARWARERRKNSA